MEQRQRQNDRRNGSLSDHEGIDRRKSPGSGYTPGMSTRERKEEQQKAQQREHKAG